MRPDEPHHRWLDLADQISEGAPVDWSSAESGLSADDRRILRMLQSIAALRQLHTHDQQSDLPDLKATEGLPLPEVVPSAAPESWGNLEIRDELGRGSFGAVYRAFDPTLQRDVALKLMHPGRVVAEEARRRMIDEGRNLARVRHANVVTVYGADEHEGTAGVWMEPIDGRTLAEFVQENGALSEGETTLAGQSLCRAVAAVHAAGLLHRDIKAHNVIREDGGRLVLMDFGSGSDLDPEPRESAKTVPGTPLYLAPELLRGQDASEASDVYSLGVLLFHLATGSYPVIATSLDELKAAHHEGRLRSVGDLRPDLSTGFVAAIDGALHPDPTQRFARATDLGRALSGLGSTTAAPDSHTPTGARRHLWIFALAAGLGLFALGLFSPLRSLLTGGGSYTVDASLYRWGESTREELFAGARVRVDDALGLEIEGSKDLYVYVFNEDERGRHHRLFPVPGLSPANPLAAHITHQLPGSDSDGQAFWGVDTEGGREQFVVVASPQPLPEIEALLDRLPLVGSGVTSSDEADGELVRGIGTLLKRPTITDAGRGVVAQISELMESSEEVDGVWMRRIELLSSR